MCSGGEGLYVSLPRKGFLVRSLFNQENDEEMAGLLMKHALISGHSLAVWFPSNFKIFSGKPDPGLPILIC